jgi:hypothetical protein
MPHWKNRAIVHHILGYLEGMGWKVAWYRGRFMGEGSFICNEIFSSYLINPSQKHLVCTCELGSTNNFVPGVCCSLWQRRAWRSASGRRTGGRVVLCSHPVRISRLHHNICTSNRNGREVHFRSSLYLRTARNVMILTRQHPLQGSLEGVGPEMATSKTSAPKSVEIFKAHPFQWSE